MEFTIYATVGLPGPTFLHNLHVFWLILLFTLLFCPYVDFFRFFSFCDENHVPNVQVDTVRSSFLWKQNKLSTKVLKHQLIFFNSKNG
jgi:hypothetical protein